MINSDKGIFETKLKLYEIDALKNPYFIRISKSAIANIDKVNNFEMSFGGSMSINLKKGSKEYASRRYVLLINI